MYGLERKIALVTGAAGNLGRATAEKFRQAGAKLILVDRDAIGLQELYAGWDREFCHPVPADLTDPDAVTQMVDAGIARFDRIDCLINIAGGFAMGSRIHEVDIESWDYMLNLNARSVFLVSRCVLPHMLNQGGGCIISVSARAALQIKPRMAAYCVSKRAVITLTEAMACEYKHDNISINCILPGTIDTPQNRTDMPAADHGKWVKPEAIADVILFFSSDAASAVTGASIPVYGES